MQGAAVDTRGAALTKQGFTATSLVLSSSLATAQFQPLLPRIPPDVEGMVTLGRLSGDQQGLPLPAGKPNGASPVIDVRRAYSELLI